MASPLYSTSIHMAASSHSSFVAIPLIILLGEKWTQLNVFEMPPGYGLCPHLQRQNIGIVTVLITHPCWLQRQGPGKDIYFHNISVRAVIIPFWRWENRVPCLSTWIEISLIKKKKKWKHYHGLLNLSQLQTSSNKKSHPQKGANFRVGKYNQKELFHLIPNYWMLMEWFGKWRGKDLLLTGPFLFRAQSYLYPSYNLPPEMDGLGY